MKSRIFAVLIILMILTSCTAPRKSNLTEAESIKAESLIAAVNLINVSAPETISSSLTLNGYNGGKKYSFEGKLLFDRKGYYRLMLTDYVFKSPVAENIRELKRLYFYNPVEKVVYSDDIDYVDLSRYTGFEIDYSFLYMLFTGKIPLLGDYSVHKCVLDNDNSGYNLIIENDDFYENIYFKNDLPEKIMFIHKLTGKKGEIYLSSPLKSGNGIFYRKFMIKVPSMNAAVNINFIQPVLNKNISIKKFDVNRLPKNIRVVEVN